MKFAGEFIVKAPRETVFKALRDARFFASCVQGVGDLTEVDATHYSAVMETKVAYMTFRFNVTVELMRVEPPDVIEAKVEGTPLGIVGRMAATSATRLTDTEDGTKIAYEVDATLAGKLGSIGQPVLRSKAKQMENEFTARLRKAFEPQQSPQ